LLLSRHYFIVEDIYHLWISGVQWQRFESVTMASAFCLGEFTGMWDGLGVTAVFFCWFEGKDSIEG